MFFHFVLPVSLLFSRKKKEFDPCLWALLCSSTSLFFGWWQTYSIIEESSIIESIIQSVLYIVFLAVVSLYDDDAGWWPPPLSTAHRSAPPEYIRQQQRVRPRPRDFIYTQTRFPIFLSSRVYKQRHKSWIDKIWRTTTTKLMIWWASLFAVLYISSCGSTAHIIYSCFGRVGEKH